MTEYVGLDVSLKETSVCVLDGSGRVLWRGTCKAAPEAMAALIRKRAPEAERMVLESGTLSTWHWHGLKALARKLAVTLFAMWRKGEAFRWSQPNTEPLPMAA